MTAMASTAFAGAGIAGWTAGCSVTGPLVAGVAGNSIAVCCGRVGKDGGGNVETGAALRAEGLEGADSGDGKGDGVLVAAVSSAAGGASSASAAGAGALL